MKHLAAAFVKAQKDFSPALKTATNPFFKSKYADLAACVEAVIDALNDNGIALMQHCSESDTGVVVETVFLHESGEMMSCGKLHVPASKNDPQGYGSALTYARRYSLMAACGIAPEDDDGNAATKNKTVTYKFKRGEKDEVMGKVLQGLSDGDEVAIKAVLHEYDTPESKMAVWALFSAGERSAIKSLITEDK